MKAVAFSYLLAVFLCLPAIGSAYQTKHIGDRTLVVLGILVVLAGLEMYAL